MEKLGETVPTCLLVFHLFWHCCSASTTLVCGVFTEWMDEIGVRQQRLLSIIPSLSASHVNIGATLVT